MTRDPLLSKIHVARAQTGLVDADYRALLVRVASVDSAAKLDERAKIKVLDELKRLGWAPRVNGARKGEGGKPHAKPHLRKIFALWGELEHAGALQNPSRAGLDAFVRRQTQAASVEWLTAAQANSVTEALKAMLKRAGKEVS
jgi:phage gp16-like protein